MQRMLTMGGFCPAPAAVLLWLFQLTSSSPEQLAACCRVMLLRSAGPAAAVQAQHMGVYRISGLLNGRPVYGHVRNRRSRILNGKTISVKNSWHISGSVLDPHSMVFWIRIQVLEKNINNGYISKNYFQTTKEDPTAGRYNSQLFVFWYHTIHTYKGLFFPATIYSTIQQWYKNCVNHFWQGLEKPVW